MGWSNYIIIDDFKLIVEISRDVDNIANYEVNALTKLIDAYQDDNIVTDNGIDMQDIKISDMTIGNLTTLYNVYKNANDICEMQIDKFLLYWLKHRKINYNIKSEYNIDIQGYIDEGYNILSR